jgi:tetratricopeptide (TPR) repeat protein
MQSSHETQPRNPLKGQDLNKFKNQPTGNMVYMDPNDDVSGPGCVVWGIVGMVSVLLAGVLVMISLFAGWNSGVTIARANATATIASDIQIQCDRMQSDIDGGNTGLLQRRIEVLQEITPAPDCLSEFIPIATTLYIQSLPTETPLPTQTPSPQATEITVIEATATPEVVATEASSSLFEYDLDALLVEAETQLADQNYQDAIDTLDAMIAIDENFQRTKIESLYFNALTSEATRLFHTGSLAEGIVITGRAEAYGDILGLNYERFIAQLFLDAVRLKITNPVESVRLFGRIAYEQGLTNYLNGQVMTELQEAYANYGNSLSEQGSFCSARDQYNASLQLQPIVTNILRSDVTGKRDSAEQACIGVAPTGDSTPIQVDSGDGSTTQPLPTPIPTVGIAPVGQQGD